MSVSCEGWQHMRIPPGRKKLTDSFTSGEKGAAGGGVSVMWAGNTAGSLAHRSDFATSGGHSRKEVKGMS